MHVPPFIATIVYVIGIAGLFWLDRDPEARTSKALWLPVVYLLVTGSRPVSEWLGMSPPSPVNGIYSNPTDRAVDLVLLAGGVAVLAARSEKVRSLLRRNSPVLLFFFYAAFSMLWSDFPYVTFKHWTKGIEDVVMVLIVLTEADPMTAIKRLLTRAGFVLLPISLLLSKYYPNLGHVMSKSWMIEYVGVTTQKNQLGMICLVFGLGGLWCFLRAYRDRGNIARRRRLLAYGALTGIAISNLQMSDSMTALVCFVLAGTVMVLASGPATNARPVFVHFLVAAALGIAIIPVFFDQSLAVFVGRDPTLSGRTEIWKTVCALVQHPWLGAGYETFLMGPRLVKLRAIFEDTFQEAHNGYLEMYLNLGWIGVALLGLLIATGYRKIIGAYRRDPAAGSLYLAFVLSTIISSFTEAAFRMMDTRWIIFLLAIMAASSGTAPKDDERDGQPGWELETSEEMSARFEDAVI